MAAESASQVPVVFEDVAVYFCPEEWAQLAEWQKELYQDVMEDTFELVASLGSVPPPKPELICKIEQGEEPCVVDPRSSSRPEEREACGGPSPADWGGSVPQQRIKEEAVAPGSWSPTAFPDGRLPGPDFRSLETCPSWCEVKLTDLRSVLQGPSWASGGSLEAGGTVRCQELLICSECGETFEEIEALSGHQSRLHAGEPGKGPFACPACGKCFRSRLNLLAHKKHRGKSRHTCSRCPAVCCLRGDLLRHRAAHAAQGGHPCGLCGLVFRHRVHLLAHKGEHGGGAPAHQCPSCSAAFGSLAELREHRAAHQEERPFACRQCGESFSWKESLQIHQRQRRHAQEGGYSCPTCGRTFSRQGNLLAHQRLHTGELPFACPECQRGFPTKASLMAHRRLHLRARPLACLRCGHGFRSQEKLRQHQASHGGSGEQEVKQEVKQEAGEP